MPQKSFEEQLRNKAQEFSPTPRAGMWEGIEAQLQPEKKKRRAAFWLYMSVACMLVLGCVVYIFRSQAMQHDNTIAETSTAAQEPAISSAIAPPVQDAAGPGVVSGNVNQPDNANSGAASLHHGSNNHSDKYKTANTGSHKHSTASAEKPVVNYTANSGKVETPGENPLTGNEIKSAGETNTHETSAVTDISNDEEAQKEANKDEKKLLVDAPVNKIKDTVKKADQTAVKIKSPSVNRKYVEFVAMPMLSASWVNIDKDYKDSSIYKLHADDRRSNDKKTWNFGFGLQFGIEKERYQVFAGLHYQSLSYKMFVRNINSEILRGSAANLTQFDYDATDSFAAAGKFVAQLSPNYPNPPEGSESYVTNKFQYLSVPIGITYMVKHTGKLRFGASVYAAPQILLSYKGLLYQEESGFYVKQKTAAEDHISKFNISAAAGIEISYMAGASSSFVLRPQFGISMLPAENARINTRNSFRAVSIGFRKYF